MLISKTSLPLSWMSAEWTTACNDIPIVTTRTCLCLPLIYRVENRRGGIAPFSVPAHQNGRADFSYPALRLASPQDTWRQPAALTSNALSSRRSSPLVGGYLPSPVAIPFLDRRSQPPHIPVDDAAGYRSQEVRVRDRVKILRLSPTVQRVRLLDDINRPPMRPVTIDTVLEILLKGRLQHDLGGGLKHPVPDRRDAERPLTAAVSGHHHPPHWIRLQVFETSSSHEPTSNTSTPVASICPKVMVLAANQATNGRLRSKPAEDPTQS